jgi:hypothetical protein
VINVQGKDQARGGSFHFLGNKYKWHAVCVFFIKKINMDNPQLAGQVLGLALSLFFFLY